MSPKNAAEMQINRTKAITRENRETGRQGDATRSAVKNRDSLESHTRRDTWEVNAYEI
jgi:hypothetical protein